MAPSTSTSSRVTSSSSLTSRPPLLASLASWTMPATTTCITTPGVATLTLI
uniref:Uncharacterized protein n=1 Tax=Anguilla anguilla TaxID=7936 RepID=A0A0E9W447_ANGAN